MAPGLEGWCLWRIGCPPAQEAPACPRRPGVTGGEAQSGQLRTLGALSALAAPFTLDSDPAWLEGEEAQPNPG